MKAICRSAVTQLRSLSSDAIDACKTRPTCNPYTYSDVLATFTIFRKSALMTPRELHFHRLGYVFSPNRGTFSFKWRLYWSSYFRTSPKRLRPWGGGLPPPSKTSPPLVTGGPTGASHSQRTSRKPCSDDGLAASGRDAHEIGCLGGAIGEWTLSKSLVF